MFVKEVQFIQKVFTSGAFVTSSSRNEKAGKG